MLTEEERGRRDRLRMLRHKYGLLASGDTPPAPRKQHWLTPRQRALLGQSPFVSESAVLRQREKVQYLGDKVDAYTEQARELTRRIEAARETRKPSQATRFLSAPHAIGTQRETMSSINSNAR